MMIGLIGTCSVLSNNKKGYV